MSEGRVFWLTNLAPPYRRPIWTGVAKNFDLTVALTGRDEAHRVWSMANSEDEPFTITSIAGSWRARLEAARTMLGSDVIVVGGWHQPEYLLAVLLNRGVQPVLAFYESTASTHRYSSGPVAWVRRAFFRSVDAVLAVGEDSRASVVAQGVAVEHTVQGPQVVDGEFFRTATAKARIGRPDRPGRHLLYVGQLVERKNVETALRAWGHQAGPDDRFTVVGTGELRGRLGEIVDELGVGDRVTFEDHRPPDRLVELYADADTLVLPSTREVWGMVVNEALAAGLHVVLSDRSGAAAAVRHMRGVFVCPPTEESLTTAMAASARAWAGPIEDPEILGFSPELFVERTIEAIVLARDLRARRPSRIPWRRSDRRDRRIQI